MDNETELVEEEVETSEEVNQAIVTTPGTGTTAVATGPVGPVVEEVDETRFMTSWRRILVSPVVKKLV